MSTKQEVLDAIAAEKLEVSAKLTAQTTQIAELNSTVQSLKDQMAAGTPVTPEDLDEILNAVHDIFVPDAAPAAEAQATNSDNSAATQS